jgi:putative NADH-flavin reductase
MIELAARSRPDPLDKWKTTGHIRCMSSIVVFGATGFAGRHITNELLDRGHVVRGVARDVSSLATRSNLSTRAGSIHDSALVREVLEGADDVVVSVPASADGSLELRDVVSAVLELAAVTGTRVGIVGGAGSLYSVADGPRVLELPEWPKEFLPIAEAHARALAFLRTASTPVDWYYVSPPFEFGSWVPGTRTGSYRVGRDILLKDPDGRAHISGEDMAIAFADEIEKPTHHQMRFTVGY